MPAPAAQFSPELPWAAGTRGTIILKDPVSKDDLLNGALTFVGVNGQLYQPEDSDGYVDYRDENDSQVFSIAFDDDETKNVLRVGVAQDADVQRVVVGPAVGSVEGVTAVNEQLQELTVGESGFLATNAYEGDVGSRCLLTQDGHNAIPATRVENIGDNFTVVVLDRETPVTINSLLKLPTVQPSGQAAGLQMLRCELFSENNDAVIRVLHAPADDSASGATSAQLFNENNQRASWGDSVRKIILH